MNNPRHDAFILANYKSLGPTKISGILDIPKGTVVTRYGILIGRRKGDRYYKMPDFYKLSTRSREDGLERGGVVPGLPKVSLDR